MSDFKTLFTSTIAKIKTWVQEGFDQIIKDLDDRDARFKEVMADFEYSLEKKMNDAIIEKFNAIKLPQDGLGIDKVDFSLNGKTLNIRSFYSNGKNTDNTFLLPIPVYTGVYKSENTYQKGDFVTFGGSLWHCNDDEPQDKPGKSAAWTLAVKKGNDA